MILIIGGSCQGKLEFAKQLSGGMGSGNRESRQEGCNGETKKGSLTVADGSRDERNMAYRVSVVTKFHEYIKRILQEEMTEEAVQRFIETLLRENPDVIVLMDEVGYGIVPVKQEDRIYREVTGRAGQALAREADQVYRVICGIGTKIK